MSASVHLKNMLIRSLFAPSVRRPRRGTPGKVYEGFKGALGKRAG
jgi:hypothetical protein